MRCIMSSIIYIKKRIDKINKLIIENLNNLDELKVQYKKILIELTVDSKVLYACVKANLDLSRDYHDDDFNELIENCKQDIIIDEINTYDDGYDINGPFYLYNELVLFDYDVDFKYSVAKWFKIIRDYTILDYEEIIYIFYICIKNPDIGIYLELDFNDFEILLLLMIILYLLEEINRDQYKTFKKILKSHTKCTENYVYNKQREYCDIDLGVKELYFINDKTENYELNKIILNNNKIEYLGIIKNLKKLIIKSEYLNDNTFIKDFIKNNVDIRLKYLNK